MKKITTLFLSLLFVMSAMISNAAEYSVYFDNSAKWSKVNIYGWDGGLNFGAWPGKNITNYEKTPEGYIKVTVTADSDPGAAGGKIIFNNGSAQTADLKWTTNMIYTKNGSTGQLYGGGEVEIFEYKVYFDNSISKWSKVYIHTWNGIGSTWPGTEVTEKTAEGYYVYTVKGESSPAGAGLLFHNNSGSQTADLVWVDNAIYNKNGNTGKTYGTSEPDVPATYVYNVTVPAGTPNCYIVGDFNEWGAFVPMTKVDDTHYTISLDNVTKASTYKYTCGEGWDYVEMQADGTTDVVNRTWAEKDVVAAWKAVPNTDPVEPETLVYSVTVPEGTPNCFIVGDFNEWGAFVPMTKVEENLFTITLDNVTKSSAYKYTCGEGWDYVEMQADGVTDVVNRTWAENDVVATWKMTTGVENFTSNDTKVYGTNNAICINTTKETSFNIYNAQGMLVKTIVVDGNETINLPAGLYIVNQTKVLVF